MSRIIFMHNGNFRNDAKFLLMIIRTMLQCFLGETIKLSQFFRESFSKNCGYFQPKFISAKWISEKMLSKFELMRQKRLFCWLFTRRVNIVNYSAESFMEDSIHREPSWTLSKYTVESATREKQTTALLKRFLKGTFDLLIFLTQQSILETLMSFELIENQREKNQASLQSQKVFIEP